MTTTPPPAPTEPSAEALAALPDGRESLQTGLGKALLRFESALGTAWCTDQRESATTASMKRDWGRADDARANLKREIRLALDRFRAAGVREERERCAALLEQVAADDDTSDVGERAADAFNHRDRHRTMSERLKSWNDVLATAIRSGASP